MSVRAHIAGLDGLRGLALVVIMGYHLAPDAVPGGFITLTLFFALSGYLITTLVLNDIEAGRFALGRFYARRVRRLLPAALLVLAAIALVWLAAGWMDTEVRTDVGAAAGQVFNWREVVRGQIYGAETVSPVMHYWSLAVEEQVYLILPVLLLVGRRRPGWVLAAAMAVPVVSTVVWAGDRSVLYYGTHVRAGEVLCGALAAVAVRRRGALPRRVATAVSGAALAGVLTVALAVGVNDPRLYQGGLLAGGLLTAVTVATVPMGSLSRWIDNAALVHVGRLSYVIYLVHWPVMIALRRVGWAQWPVGLATVAVSLAVAEVVHRWYETPMRSVWGWRRFGAVLATVVLVAGASTVGAARAPVSFEEAERDLALRNEELSPTGEGPTLAIFGDSKMLSLGMGMGPVDGFDLVYMHAILRCPLGRGGEMLINDVPYAVAPECAWERIRNRDAEVAVVWFGTWDARGRRIPALGEAWLGIEDPAYRRWLTDEYEEYFEMLRSRLGTNVIALMNLHPNGVTDFDRFNDFLGDLAALHEDVVVLPFAEWVATQNVASILPDGVHLSWGQPVAYSPGTDNSALEVMRVWLAPVLCRTVSSRLGEDRAGEECESIGRRDPSAGS